MSTEETAEQKRPHRYPLSVVNLFVACAASAGVFTGLYVARHWPREFGMPQAEQAGIAAGGKPISLTPFETQVVLMLRDETVDSLFVSWRERNFSKGWHARVEHKERPGAQFGPDGILIEEPKE
jgi:hypothetical protein